MEVPPEMEVELEVLLQEEQVGAGVLSEKELKESPQVPREDEESDGAEDAVSWGGFVSNTFSDGVTEDDELVAPVPLSVDRTGLERERKSWSCWLAGAYPPFRFIATDAGNHRGREGGKRGRGKTSKATAHREGGGVTWAALAEKAVV